MVLRLGDMLISRGLITEEDLDAAIQEQQQTKEYLGQVLMRSGRVQEKAFLEVLAEQQGLPFVDLKTYPIDGKTIRDVPPKYAWHYKIMPVRLEGNVLTVAISDPFDMWPIDDLETNLGYTVEKVLATSPDIQDAIQRHYGVAGDTIERILSEQEPDDAADREAPGPAADAASAPREAAAPAGDEVQDLEKMAADASVIRLVNQILQQAIQERATDIHLEVQREDAALRYRVDGVLRPAQVSDKIKFLHAAILTRIKVMAGLDIIERRLPQDGRSKVKVAGEEYDLRISILPALHGECLVIRILPTTMLFDLADLGMQSAHLETLRHLIAAPHGILFITGPTGSGKSTTLYAALSRLNTPERKILTVEDPVEYELPGINQVQVRPEIGLTFARVLRSMLRHDPEVMMVGEIRDLETAQIAVQAALTGHLVFSTLHTNDAASGVTRLLDIGVEPYLVASASEAFVAQRLVRCVCTDCAEASEPSAFDTRVRSALAVAAPGQDWTLRQGAGCDVCGRTGYRGRTGIYEILPVNEALRDLVLDRASADALRQRAMEDGMEPLRRDGWRKAAAGLTTPEEVLRVTSDRYDVAAEAVAVER